MFHRKTQMKLWIVVHRGQNFNGANWHIMPAQFDNCHIELALYVNWIR